MATENFATTLAPRKAFAAGNPNPDIPAYFEHKAASEPSGKPALPGVLNAIEYAQVRAWLAGGIAPTLSHAIAKQREFEAWYATPEYKAWRVAEHFNRKAQARNVDADAQIANQTVIANSATTSGSGGGDPAPVYVPPGQNLPDP